jgi:signal transduction histidine kinase
MAVGAANQPAGVGVEIDAAPDATVDADRDQLARVITNLLINAAQAMDGRGRVWIEARRAGSETSLVVRDEGPGVPAEVRPRIFEALFTTKAKGSGLGLALCRRIAEAHGGAIALEPSARGASFRVVIPDLARGEGTVP